MSKIAAKNVNAHIATKKFLKRLNGIIHQSFTKIRIKEDCDNDDIVKLFNERRILRSKDDELSKKRLTEIETELADKCTKANHQTIINEIKDTDCVEGGFNVGKLWKLKKKLCPYKKDSPTAM